MRSACVGVLCVRIEGDVCRSGIGRMIFGEWCDEGDMKGGGGWVGWMSKGGLLWEQ